MIRTEIDSMPTELDVIQRKIIQHEIEEAALKRKKTPCPRSIWPRSGRSWLKCGSSSDP